MFGQSAAERADGRLPPPRSQVFHYRAQVPLEPQLYTGARSSWPS